MKITDVISIDSFFLEEEHTITDEEIEEDNDMKDRIADEKYDEYKNERK
jgi:hypothetical protein